MLLQKYCFRMLNMIQLTFHECTNYFGCLSSQKPLREDRSKIILVEQLEAVFRNMSKKRFKVKKLWRSLSLRDLVCSIQKTSLLYPTDTPPPLFFLLNKKQLD